MDEMELEEKEEKSVVLCQKCEINPSQELHTCPFKEEIYDDHEFLCDCCPECTYECRMDI